MTIKEMRVRTSTANITPAPQFCRAVASTAARVSLEEHVVMEWGLRSRCHVRTIGVKTPVTYDQRWHRAIQDGTSRLPSPDTDDIPTPHPPPKQWTITISRGRRVKLSRFPPGCASASIGGGGQTIHHGLYWHETISNTYSMHLTSSNCICLK